MYACIECGTKSEHLFMKSSTTQQICKCGSCGKRMDRYFEVNNLIKLIDLLLLKRRVFRHYLFNNTSMLENNGVHCLAMLGLLMVKSVMMSITEDGEIPRFLCAADWHEKLFMAKEVMKACKIMIAEFVELVMLIGMLMCLFGKHTGFVTLSKAVVFSSFYCLFVLVMVMWNYKPREYLIVIDFICMICNSIVISEVVGLNNETAIASFCCCRFASKIICKALYKVII
ncbi:hypothetical protein CWI42_100110 [Ordospora colligata]|uniref:Protein ARV n=1 Tax=Ordospora colligata OC4 TaxID=1354746 RepID=A0A0B2UIZ2_9MICR|nr:uncharacterized protein M896_100110 [Ordospora colligata OC4]KHN69027.1 hypothetical protein M896_100110 [Ordospora colligata OC4]TBU14308.1 hypothetical protein CWI40_100120 [Ordospora colligata]TBU14373.1 hypothetical protein CWI41_100120 [Ordospora colligata]TBU17989.1 hypothetical protein CWI42_100110 [Ordospora colligata]